MTDAGNLALLGRVMGGLIVVLVLIGLAARVARRSRGRTNTTGLRVVDRIGLSRDANLTVIEVANRLLLLGVTAQGVTMLADLDALVERDDDPEPEVSGVLTTGVAQPDRNEPPRTPPAEPRAQRRPVPSAVALEEYPDLASALRAAGRTTSAAAAAADVTAPTPRTRAEARAEARARASVAAQNQAQSNASAAQTAAPPAITPRPETTSSTEVDRIPQPRNQSGGKKRVVHRPTPQASGSVLSPRTWRQGIEALRDLTVRRG